jgi:hypothetical protein
MSSKISALPNLSKVHDVDEFTLVSSGTNYRCGRDVILTAWDGDFVALQGYGSSVSILPSSEVQTQLATGAVLQITGPVTEYLNIVEGGSTVVFSAGDYDVTAAGRLTFTNGVSTIEFALVGSIVATAATGQRFDGTYYETSIGHWAGIPTLYSEAIRRLAMAVSGLLGGPIP